MKTLAGFFCALWMLWVAGVTGQSLRDIVNESDQKPEALHGLGPIKCFPPGMPEPSLLIRIGDNSMSAPVEGSDDHVSVTAVGLVLREHLEAFHHGQHGIDYIAYVIDGLLAAVDDHPGDPNEPDIVDTGMVTAKGATLRERKQSCQWLRLKPSEPREHTNGSEHWERI